MREQSPVPGMRGGFNDRIGKLKGSSGGGEEGLITFSWLKLKAL